MMLWRSPFLLFECFFRARQKQFQIEYGNSEYSGISSIFESWIIQGLPPRSLCWNENDLIWCVDGRFVSNR